MEDPSNQENKNDKIISQSKDEIESLNDNENLDIESLEEISGGANVKDCPNLRECTCTDNKPIIVN